LTDGGVIPGSRLLRFGWQALLGVAITTLVAGAATGIFAAYHFERVASYSLLGNLLAAPLVSLIIMPFGLLSLVLMPFGLEPLPLYVMARGIDTLLAVSGSVASLPGAEVRAPAIASLSLVLIVVGLLWLCLWRRRWRLFGVPAIALGLVSIPMLLDPPDLLVAPEGNAVAVRDASGVLRVAGGKPGSYVVEQLFDKEGAAPEDAATLREGAVCDDSACLLRGREEFLVSHVRDPTAFAEDCRSATVIATTLVAPSECRAPLVIDAERIRIFGAHAVRFGRDGGRPTFRVTTDRSATPRPWQPRASP
jgi:competence protein ComEC